MPRVSCVLCAYQKEYGHAPGHRCRGSGDEQTVDGESSERSLPARSRFSCGGAAQYPDPVALPACGVEESEGVMNDGEGDGVTEVVGVTDGVADGGTKDGETETDGVEEGGT